MSFYLTLNHVQIQNANCVAGVTYGFPAVTQFLGYVHALSRKLKASHDLTLGGCAIICHQYQIHSYRLTSIKDGKEILGDYYFKQTKNPAAFPYQEGDIGKAPPIIEEGKMHLTVSLVIECEGFIANEADKNNVLKHIKQLCLTHKLAGGTIAKIKDVFLESFTDEKDFRRIRRRLIPGFILLDRSHYLSDHLQKLKTNNSNAEMLDAWLDFSALKYKAIPHLKPDEIFSNETHAEWEYQEKPFSGWLVPITTGYRAISELYEKGVVANARDSESPFCFVEAVYGIGEWLSLHRINDLQQMLWHYAEPENGWYLCKQNLIKFQSASIEVKDDTDDLYFFND